MFSGESMVEQGFQPPLDGLTLDKMMSDRLKKIPALFGKCWERLTNYY